MSVLTQGSKIAVVLAGAVAKGAFEAGALRVLARQNVQIARVVAASSGALNGAMVAAGVHAGDVAGYTDALTALWRDHGGFGDVVHVAWRDALSLRGVSDQSRLIALTRSHIRAAPRRADVHLDVIVAPLRGSTGAIGDAPATTYERVMSFDSADFESDDRLEALFRAVAASASFPGLFAPEDLPDLGPSVDGGVVNNTPIKYAIADGIDAVVVVAPTVENDVAPAAPPGGIPLVGRLAEMLVNERLYRDLREAHATNRRLAAVDALVPDRLPAGALREVKAALGLATKRQVPIVEIRPLAPLVGDAFTGFIDRAAREAYLAAGEARARDVLGA